MIHAGSGAMAQNNSMPPLRNSATMIVDDDARDSDILQKATKRRQGLQEKRKQQQQLTDGNDIGAATESNQPIPLDTDSSKIETTPKQNKGILGFFRGGVSIELSFPLTL